MRKTSTVRNTPDAINVLRVIACMMVLMLHALVFMQGAGFDLYNYKDTHPLVFLLKTPAWAGVWIFFVLSSYLAGRSFFLGRYKYSFRGFVGYYVKKVLRIIIPVYAFIILTCTLVFPAFLYENPIAIPRLLFFNYTGDPGMDAIGALWYVSTIMPVYLFAPFICLILDKTIGLLCRKHELAGKLVALALMAVAIFVGYTHRVSLMEVETTIWYKQVYVSTLANSDMFLCGFLLNFITLKNNPQKRLPVWARTAVKIVAVGGLLYLIGYTSHLYFYGERLDFDLVEIYQYKMPTAFLVASCFYIFAFDYERERRQAPLTPINCLKNPARVLDFLSGISFEIYMFHSLIYARIWPYFAPINGFGGYVRLLLVGFVLSIAFGYAFHKIFDRKKSPPRQTAKAQTDVEKPSTQES